MFWLSVRLSAFVDFVFSFFLYPVSLAFDDTTPMRFPWCAA